MSKITKEQMLELWGMMTQNIEVESDSGNNSGSSGTYKWRTFILEIRKGVNFKIEISEKMYGDLSKKYKISAPIFGSHDLTEKEYNEADEVFTYRSGNAQNEFEYIKKILLR